MARLYQAEEDILLRGTGAYVMDDQWAIADSSIGYDADVWSSGRKPPGHEITWPVSRAIVLDRQGGALPPKEGREIRNAAVIDVSVRTGKSPKPRILGPRFLHVFVHRHLKIEADGSVGANDHVRAGSAPDRNVPSGIRQDTIGAVVDHRHADLRPRGSNQPGRLALGQERSALAQREKPQDKKPTHRFS